MDPYVAATVPAELVKDVSNHWQFAAFTVLCITAIMIYWMQKVKSDNKKLIEKQHELDKAETANRVIVRDKQISEIKAEHAKEIAEVTKRIEKVSTVAHGVGDSFDKHVNDHKERDEKFWTNISTIDQRLRRIEDNLIERNEFMSLQSAVHDIDKTVVKIYAVMEERNRGLAYAAMNSEQN